MRVHHGIFRQTKVHTDTLPEQVNCWGRFSDLTEGAVIFALSSRCGHSIYNRVLIYIHFIKLLSEKFQTESYYRFCFEDIYVHSRNVNNNNIGEEDVHLQVISTTQRTPQQAPPLHQDQWGWE